jgi:uncharacterized protein (DUF2164 family)
MARERIRKEDIKVVIMNPEAIPFVQERMFDFFYERFMNDMAKNDLRKLESANTELLEN